MAANHENKEHVHIVWVTMICCMWFTFSTVDYLDRSVMNSTIFASSDSLYKSRSTIILLAIVCHMQTSILHDYELAGVVHGQHNTIGTCHIHRQDAVFYHNPSNTF